MSIVYILLYNPEMHVMYIGMYVHKCFIIPTKNKGSLFCNQECCKCCNYGVIICVVNVIYRIVNFFFKNEQKSHPLSLRY